ncbi:MAG: hypothetical protein LUG52_02655 [Clostridia bacterium]|nr:hypothetical protein [Clostridia bacterium]
MRFENLLAESAEYEDILSAAQNDNYPIHIVGPSESVKAHFVVSLLKNLNKKGFIITHSELQARKLYDDISFFAPQRAVMVPETDVLLYKIEAADNAAENNRMGALTEIAQKDFVIMSVLSFLEYVLPSDELDSMTLELKTGDEMPMSELTERLIKMGYTRLDSVAGQGQFAVRGGIVDLYPPSSEPYRIEFFGDEVDLIKVFDTETQLSAAKRDSVKIIPASSRSFAGSILSYINHGDLVILDEPVRISESAEAVRLELEENIKTLMESGGEVDAKKEYIQDYSKLMGKIAKENVLSVAALSRACPDVKPKSTFNLTAKTMQNYGGNIEFLYDDLKMWTAAHYKIYVLGGSRERAGKLCEAMRERGFKAVYAEDIESAGDARDAAIVTHGSVTKGFEYPLVQTVIVSDREIFAAEKKKRKVKKEPGTSKLKSADDIVPGDLVVHNVHGIGKYIGMQRLEVDGITRDYFKIEYRGADYLYIPVEQLNLIGKYVGAGEGAGVKINKLGGAEWAAAKAKVKKNVAEMAKKLTELYAERSVAKGTAFDPDSPWQREFEDEFPYEETEDQLRAIEEMKKDM